MSARVDELEPPDPEATEEEDEPHAWVDCATAQDAIEALEDRIDIEAAEESYAETGQDVTLAQMREELPAPRTAP